MKSKSRDIHVFNIAMLDVLCGALGAFMFLMLAFMPYYNVVMHFGGIEELKKLDFDEVKKLKEEIEQLKTEITDLKNQKQRLEDENATLKKRIDELEARIAELEEEIKNLREQLKMMSKGDIPKEEYLKLQREIEELKERIKELNARIEQLANENASLRTKVKELDAEITRLNGEIQARDELIKKLQAEIEELKKKLGEAQQRQRELEKKLKEAEAGGPDVVHDFGAAISHVIADEAVMHDLQEKLRQLPREHGNRSTPGQTTYALFSVFTKSDQNAPVELLIRDPQMYWYDASSVNLSSIRSVQLADLSATGKQPVAGHGGQLLAIDSLRDEGVYFLALRRLPGGPEMPVEVNGTLILRNHLGAYTLDQMPKEVAPPDGSIAVVGKIELQGEMAKIEWLSEVSDPKSINERKEMEASLREHPIQPERHTESPQSLDAESPAVRIQMLKRRLIGANVLLKRLEAEPGPGGREQVTALRERIKATEDEIAGLVNTVSSGAQSTSASP